MDYDNPDHVLALLMLAYVPRVFAVPYQTLMPVFQKDVLHVGPEGLGLLMAGPGIGAVSQVQRRSRGKSTIVNAINASANAPPHSATYSICASSSACSPTAQVSSTNTIKGASDENRKRVCRRRTRAASRPPSSRS